MNTGQRHQGPRRETGRYLTLRDPDAYWRAAIAREMARAEEANPGIFSPTQTPAAEQVGRCR
jgi:hypothetical protein